MKKILFQMALFCLSPIGLFAGWGNNYWKLQTETAAFRNANRQIVPNKYLTVELDLEQFSQDLKSAPLEFDNLFKSAPKIIVLPMPNGKFEEFAIYEAPIMASELSAKYPEVKTYAGQGITNTYAAIRFDITPKGFHAMIRSEEGDIFIDPYAEGMTTSYISYYRKDYQNDAKKLNCLTDELPSNQEKKLNRQTLEEFNANRSIAGELRTYRLALACTREYSSYHGGTKPLVLAAMVTSMNRVNFVYETEVGIRMVLVPNNDTLIYLGADPFANDDGFSMLGQNQNVCNSRIGSANYDIGHVFSTGGGGVASLGCVCSNGIKAQGVTGLPTPIGDQFDIDYVAHEMGHQFGADHTFNSKTGSCAGNGNSSTAYEPGSGITIMGYAGICGNDDLAPHSIATFHTISFDQIVNFSQNSSGNGCAVMTLTGNNAPTIAPLDTHTIPYNTPFWLDGSASDPDGQTVTYSWEQFNRGSFGGWQNPAGNSPIFRSYDPTLESKRYFPKLANVLNNVNTIGELKPSKARVLNFRLTARDNQTGGGGVTYAEDKAVVNVIKTSVPFAITEPNTTGISLAVGETKDILWDVAETDTGVINTPFVNIKLSTDGGLTFPIEIANNVPNNGTFSWVVSDNITTKGRIWIEGAGNIFFDINDKNFVIAASTGINSNVLSNSFDVFPNPANNNFNLIVNSKGKDLSIKLINNLGQVIKETLVSNPTEKYAITYDINGLSPGIYFVQIENNLGKGIKKLIVE
ncbi:MAG: T9SS type A sorting domain-containing protein [Bacteroidetes bacterium]|nr:T9SS type A sorting domain-containing protein [Bacteroidota bacterium]